MEFIVILWNEVIIRPMLNTLMVFYVISWEHMGIAIILFTVLVKAATMPLTLKQIKQMRVMSTLQPKMKDLQAKYSGDRARASQETMKLYKEAGVNPIGCLGPMVVQMPILIGLFRVLIQTLFAKPEDLIGLSEKLYSWIPIFPIHSVVPLNATFLGVLDLSEPDPTRVVIPALVFVSTWVQQKLTVSPSTDPRQQSNQTMMLWMTLMNGAAGAMFWQYRPEYVTFESPGYNMVALDGEPTPRFREVVRVVEKRISPLMRDDACSLWMKTAEN